MASKESTLDRIQDATRLIEDFSLAEDAEYFADPPNRVAFLQSLTTDEFVGIAQHINARMRGFEPRDQINAHDRGGFLPMLGTPSADEKPEAFRTGFETIKAYLEESSDTPRKKLKSAAMATEALVIWVHLFNDGNGRTSRFLGKFIEDGTTDTEQLVAETADNNNRLRMYDGKLRIDQYNIYKDMDVLLDEDEEEELKKTKMPVVEGISLSLKRLMENQSVQGEVEAKTERLRATQDHLKSVLAAHRAA